MICSFSAILKCLWEWSDFLHEARFLLITPLEISILQPLTTLIKPISALLLLNTSQLQLITNTSSRERFSKIFKNLYMHFCEFLVRFYKV